MTILVKITNTDTRPNAIIAISAQDSWIDSDNIPHSSIISIATLSGGENVDTYLTSTRELKIREIQNG